MLKEIVISIQSYFQAHQFINKHQLWKWILIPGVIYAFLFMVSMFFFGKTATFVIEYITNISGIREWIQKLQNSWLGFFFTVAGVIFWLILMLLYFSMFKHFWLIVGSPIFSYLSEKTQAIIDGNEYPFNFLNLLKDIWRGINLAFRNMIWQTVYIISILFLSFIPIVGWATPLIAMFIECYYYGFSMLDYSMERKRFSPQQSIAFISSHKGLAVGNGIVFYLMHGFIGIGWVLAPAYAVIAATISINKYES
ncbi:MAG: EI24 domain-containing protein [Chitinophagaceae bacterium]